MIVIMSSVCIYAYQGRTQDFGRGGVVVVVKDPARFARGEILQNHAH